MPRRPVLSDLANGPVLCMYESKRAKLLAINVDPKSSRPYFIHSHTRRMWVESVVVADRPQEKQPEMPKKDKDDCDCDACQLTAQITLMLMESLPPVYAADCLCRVTENIAKAAPSVRKILKKAMKEALKKEQ